jgi:hypothetical protein
MLVLVALLTFSALGCAAYFVVIALARRQRRAWLNAVIAAILGLLIFPAIGGSMLPKKVSVRPTQPVPTPASVPAPRIKEQTITEKIVALGQNPNRNVIETDNDAGRHHYSWDRPDLGGDVGGAWYSKDNWWIKIRRPTFTHSDFEPDLEYLRSNGVATSYTVKSGLLRGGLVIESATIINIYSDSPRWHAVNDY